MPEASASSAADTALNQFVDEVLEKLRLSLSEGSKSIEQDLRGAQIACTQYRDELIRRLRKRADNDGRTDIPERLDEANIVLSLIATVEYPLQGFRTRTLEDAIKLLESRRNRP
ncbi:MAG TPA: hypothetical protein VHX65_08710 [Pirellulales bacterium]|jgi:hypothetical protein|nr:hypothetical protein [Pirellulales bacterium]